MKKVAVCSWALLLSFVLSSNVFAGQSENPFPIMEGTLGVIGSAVA